MQRAVRTYLYLALGLLCLAGLVAGAILGANFYHDYKIKDAYARIITKYQGRVTGIVSGHAFGRSR